MTSLSGLTGFQGQYAPEIWSDLWSGPVYYFPEPMDYQIWEGLVRIWLQANKAFSAHWGSAFTIDCAGYLKAPYILATGPLRINTSLKHNGTFLNNRVHQSSKPVTDPNPECQPFCKINRRVIAMTNATRSTSQNDRPCFQRRSLAPISLTQ